MFGLFVVTALIWARPFLTDCASRPSAVALVLATGLTAPRVVVARVTRPRGTRPRAGAPMLLGLPVAGCRHLPGGGYARRQRAGRIGDRDHGLAAPARAAAQRAPFPGRPAGWTMQAWPTDSPAHCRPT